MNELIYFKATKEQENNLIFEKKVYLIEIGDNLMLKILCGHQRRKKNKNS